MSLPPYIAVVIDGGVIQTVITEHWPSQLPQPRIVVVDYDKDGARDDELTEFSIGDEILEALCHIEYRHRLRPSTCRHCRPMQ
ncbi:hypothetical protein [Pseudomonas lopnurensis]|uniref:hypothetical protein n=1 Tax=Pseudomonas lopnurensis TaxID=1477517 RepID=UPI0028AD80A0|nr:hypothetical protein [Pseudomonas lopnurensis]